MPPLTSQNTESAMSLVSSLEVPVPGKEDDIFSPVSKPLWIRDIWPTDTEGTPVTA